MRESRNLLWGFQNPNKWHYNYVVQYIEIIWSPSGESVNESSQCVKHYTKNQSHITTVTKLAAYCNTYRYLAGLWKPRGNEKGFKWRTLKILRIYKRTWKIRWLLVNFFAHLVQGLWATKTVKSTVNVCLTNTLLLLGNESFFNS